MLVLSRKRQQAFVVTREGDPTVRIRVVVIETRGGSCRLGIEAPADFVISRDEPREAVDAGEFARPPRPVPAAGAGEGPGSEAIP